MPEDAGEIHFQPTDGVSYNPNDALYWSQEALRKELLRSFELCHSCRMCFKYCQSFPTLFDAIDANDGNVRKVPPSAVSQVVDECFQCKLCYTQCPYTAAEGHEFALDFPRLMMRAKAVRRRSSGIPLRDRMLADPDRLGRIGTATAALANWGNGLRLNRVAMEMVAGIHRDKRLPRFARRSFESWFRRQNDGAELTAGGRHPVVLFSTCFANYNRPEVGEAAFRVLTHNDCQIACPSLSCCGMPALDAGDIALAQRKARDNVRRLLPWVERGFAIAVVNPTCSLMMRQEVPELLRGGDGELAEAAERIAAATRDLGEYLHELRAAGHFKEDFRSTPNADVAYHAPCHLRMQNIGFRGRDLMRRIPGVKPKLVAECCGHDGTWAMKKEYFALSLKNGEKAFEGMRATGAALWTSDCPLAALQFEQACGTTVLHPIEVLDRAYREDGFEHSVSAKTEG